MGGVRVCMRVQPPGGEEGQTGSVKPSVPPRRGVEAVRNKIIRNLLIRTRKWEAGCCACLFRTLRVKRSTRTGLNLGVGLAPALEPTPPLHPAFVKLTWHRFLDDGGEAELKAVVKSIRIRPKRPFFPP